MNDQQETAMATGADPLFRHSDQTLINVLGSAMKSGFNVVYTAVPRSGLTSTLNRLLHEEFFGSHALFLTGGQVHRYCKGLLGEGDPTISRVEGSGVTTNAQGLSELSSKFAQAPLILDMPQLADSLMQVAKMIRCHLGPIFLFTDSPCEFLQSHLTLRPTIFAHDPFAEAVDANPFPFLPYGEVEGDNVLAVLPHSYLERYLLSALRKHEADPARGAYLMHVLTRVLVSRDIHRIVLSHPELLSSQYIVRTLNDALPNKGRVGYYTANGLAASLNDKPSNVHLFDSVVHDLQTYVAEI